MVLWSKFTTFVSSVKIDLGHLNIFPSHICHAVKLVCVQRTLWRYCKRKRALFLTPVCLPGRLLWLFLAPDSCNVHSCSLSSLWDAQGGRQIPPASSLASSAAECFQLDISLWIAFPGTLQGWFPASSASTAPQWLLCHSLSHSCAISTKAWIPALEWSGDPPLGDLHSTGGSCSLIYEFSVFFRIILIPY